MLQPKNFAGFPISNLTLKGLTDSGFTEPTDIQKQSLQHCLDGSDVVGAAKTGSGKTLALLIPVLECLLKNKWSRDDGLGALIITPTRELACQIFHVLNDIGKHHDFSAGVLIGGTDVGFEKERLAQINIIVCTPGRLLQHMDENENFHCDNLQILVIDEADRILDMGFTKQINAIVENLPKERQTLLFSATQTRNVKDLARVCSKDPVFVSVHEHAERPTPDQLTQSYFVCEEEEKVNMLWSYMVNHRRKKTLVFVTCCRQARFLTDALRALRPGLSLLGLWGTLNQEKRVQVFDSFDKNTAGAVLIATDVASRGLDFKRVDYVLQLDCPATVEDYIHRVGRTARMNKKGEAIMVLTPSQEDPMIANLARRGITVNKIEVDPSHVSDIRIKLQAAITEHLEYKEFAQRAIVAYAKAVHTMKMREVFDVEKIDFQALALSYGLAVAPRIRALRKKGIQVNDKRPKQELVASDEEDEDDKATISSKVPATAQSDEDDDNDSDEVFKVVRKNVFNVKKEEESAEEDLQISSKKKNKVLSKEQVGKKLLKRGALLSVKKIKFDEDGNPIENSHEIERFDVNEAKKRLEKCKPQDKRAHLDRLKDIRKRKKRKSNKNKDKEDVLDLADASDDDHDVDLSWLPNPDKPKDFDDDDDDAIDVQPKKKKRKQQAIKGAEEQALALLGMS